MKIKVLILSIFVIVCLCTPAQKPPVTPAWAFKHLVWEDSINTSEGVIALTEMYLKHNIPVGSVIIDSPWSTAYNDFNWDTKRYPDSKRMIRFFKDKDIKVILWLTGAINLKAKDTYSQKSETYDYAVSENFGVNDSKTHEWWKGTGIHLDFTNKSATKWWGTQLDKVFIDGVYGWKVDQGELYFGDTLKTSIGTMTNEEFRPYYYDAMYDYTLSRRAGGIILARPFSHQGGYFASVEKMSLGWCGDFSGDWKGLKLQVNNIYKSAEKGYGAPGCEVAGFFQARSNMNQFIRYSQFGATTATMINGGENGAFSNHLPWYHGKEATDIYRFCVVLHEQLIPYLFSIVVDAHLQGGSLIRNVNYEQSTHQLGEYLFTKVIDSPENTVSFSLPKSGEWIDFWTNQSYAAGTKITRTYPLQEFPLFVRAGAIIPLKVQNSVTGIGDESMKDKEVILIYHQKGYSSYLYHSPVDEGVDYKDISIGYEGEKGFLTVKGKVNKEYVFILRNVKSVKDVQNASSWYFNKATQELQVQASGKNLSISINW